MVVLIGLSVLNMMVVLALGASTLLASTQSLPLALLKFEQFCSGDHLVCGTELALPQMHAIGQACHT